MMAFPTFQARVVLRGRWTIGAALVFAAVSGVVAVLGLGSFRQIGLGSAGPAAVSLLQLSLLLPTAHAMLLGALLVSGERESGLLGVLRARGLSAVQLALASWLAVLVSALLMLLAGFGLVALALAGNVPADDLLVFAGILAIAATCAAAAAALGVMIGAAAGNRLSAALLAVAAWFVLAVGLDLLIVGAGVFLRLGEPAILLAIVADPIESARVAALLVLNDGGTVLGPVGQYLLDRLGQAGSIGILLVSLAAWVVGCLALAVRSLARGDS
jgi:ABC-type transport system involved in multi-copper enzyme maturation permease subunit